MSEHVRHLGALSHLAGLTRARVSCREQEACIAAHAIRRGDDRDLRTFSDIADRGARVSHREQEAA